VGWRGAALTWQSGTCASLSLSPAGSTRLLSRGAALTWQSDACHGLLVTCRKQHARGPFMRFATSAAEGTGEKRLNNDLAVQGHCSQDTPHYTGLRVGPTHRCVLMQRVGPTDRVCPTARVGPTEGVCPTGLGWAPLTRCAPRLGVGPTRVCPWA